MPETVETAYQALPEQIDYNFQVQPILADRCYACHGPDANTRKGGLRLDDEAGAFAALASGNKALVKGKPGKSALYHRIFSDDPTMVMPPPDSKLTLTDREKAILVKWIEQGAEWKPHWAFIPVERPSVPEPVDGWQSQNPIDRFIQEKLVEKGLVPNEEADKERLLRRVTMDLTGLPPTTEEIDLFLADNDNNAYEKVVDRLLSSRAHAERLTAEWLDIARYSDSHGVSFDGIRTSWPWRDWVIGAFEENMPYDEFITEQLAGDLLENATEQQQLATAFLRMGELEASMGSIPEEYRNEYVIERTGLAGSALLGLTLECARCHDHKFDPVSQKEFYQVSAFFNNTEEMGLGTVDGNRAPTLMYFSDKDKSTLDSVNNEISVRQDTYHKARAEAEKLTEYLESLQVPDGVKEVRTYSFESFSKFNKKDGKDKDGNVKYKEVMIADGNTNTVVTEGVTLDKGYKGQAAWFNDEYEWIFLEEEGRYETFEPFSAAAWIQTNRTEKGPTQTILGNSNYYPSDYRGWDLYLDSTRQLHARLIHRLPDDYIEVMVQGAVKSKTWVHVGLTYDGLAKASGVRLFINGEERETTVLKDALTRTILPVNDYTLDTISLPLAIGRSYRIWTFDVGLFDGGIDEVAVADRQLSRVEMALLADQDPDTGNKEGLREYALLQNENLKKSRDELAESLTARKDFLDTATQVMVMKEQEKRRPTYILERGVYSNKGERVEPGTPERVLPFSEEYSPDRLGLAKWITNPGNPLTARVAVNRYWQLIFGRGLVNTPSDFGIQGSKPTHPALLDWLAAEFVSSGWDLRHMLKLMVMSATYRQSSFITDKLMENDPENIYLARGSSYRWPAEFIRDNMLAASGLLANYEGGPPVKTYQPDGLWEELGGGSYANATYKKDTLDDLYRRSIYTFERRFVTPPFMALFDASDRKLCQVQRKMTNSPLQALALMNDVQVVEASRIMAERVLHDKQTLDEQVAYAFRLTTGITPEQEVVNVLKDQYTESFQHFQANNAAADSLLSVGDRRFDDSLDKNRIAAMTMVANLIFNTDDYYMKR